MTLKADSHPRSSESSSNTAGADEPSELTPDDIFHVLQTNRRRDAIRYLLEKDNPVKMRDVAEYVAAKENETTVANLTSTQRQRVYIPLYQSHLPKLDEQDVIEYDKPRGIVRPTDRLEVFRPYLEVSSEESHRTDRDRRESEADGAAVRSDTTYYSAATAASLSLLLAAQLGVLALSGLVLGSLITLLFVLATAVTTRAGARLATRSSGPHRTDV